MVARALALVGDRDAGGALKGHGEVAVARGAEGGGIGEFAAPVINANRARNLLLAEAKADAEEVSHGSLDARLRFAVPVIAQDVVLQMVRFVAGDVIAEMDDASRPLDLRQDQGLAGV